MRRMFIGAGLATLALPGELADHFSLWAIAGMGALAGFIAAAVRHD